MLYEQAAATSPGRSRDETSLRPPIKAEVWTSREFVAESINPCDPAKSSVVGIASGTPGKTNATVNNGRGQVRVTWSFDGSVNSQNLDFSLFEIDIINLSSKPVPTVAATAVLETSRGTFSISHRKLSLPAKPSATGNTVSFDFARLTPAPAHDSAVTVRSLTFSIDTRQECDASFALQMARVGEKRTRPKRKTDTLIDTPTASPTEGPTTNPCDEDPTVSDQIKECEEKENRRRGGCVEVTCRCVPRSVGSGYSIVPHSAWKGSIDEMDGKPCVNYACGGAPGRCSISGECGPPQFHGFRHPYFNFDGSVTFKNVDGLAVECFDITRKPSPKQLCLMTPKQAVEAMFASVLVGSSCEMSEGIHGICVARGTCIPDKRADLYCTDKVDCTSCGEKGSLCRKGKCLTYEQAARQLCEDTHFFSL